MRISINIDDDALAFLRQYAERRSLSLGKAASALIRQGLHAPTPTRMVNGVSVFDVPAEQSPITRKRVKELETGDQ